MLCRLSGATVIACPSQEGKTHNENVLRISALMETHIETMRWARGGGQTVILPTNSIILTLCPLQLILTPSPLISLSSVYTCGLFYTGLEGGGHILYQSVVLVRSESGDTYVHGRN